MTTQSATYPSTALRDRFLADHNELEDLFAGLLDAFEANDREGVALLWNEFDERLTKHLAAEERFMIPQLFASRPRDARTIMEEHRHIRSRLSELGFGVDLHIVRLETARGFIDELRAHARHEDDVLYRWADEHLAAIDRTTVLSKLMPLRKGGYTG
jgi:hemerythrin-like domain-containing protein